MSAIWNGLKNATKLLWQPASTALQNSAVASGRLQLWKPTSVVARFNSNYDPYPKFEEIPTPFKPPLKSRHGYRAKIYTGGILPRPTERFEGKPLPMPKWEPRKRDQWTEKKALFGQNDYIDILGDGSIHPWQLMEGPYWLRGFRGNEFQRLVRRMKFEGHFIRDVYPTKHHEIRKRIFFLYKRLNRRRHARFWSGKHSSNRNRIFYLDKKF